MIISPDRAGAADSGRVVLASAVFPVQPCETLVAPDHEQLYIAPVAMLPTNLRALCSCAGLFYARVQDVRESEKGSVYLMEVAALARYFVVPGATFQQHVRGFEMPADLLGFFLPWDRHLAAMATSDVRDLVEGQAERANAAISQDLAPEEPEREEEVDLLPLPQMFVSRAAVCEALQETQANEKGRRVVQTALLQAALDSISEQLEKSWIGWKERNHLEQLYDQIRAVQLWRRTRKKWQRVVTLEPVWDQGRRGWDIIIGVPSGLAA